MIRRIFMLVAAAALIVLTPSVAMAYQAPGFNSSVSDATPVAGQCVNVRVSAGVANAGATLTLKVTGPEAKTLTATANNNGVATFRVCLSAVGDYALTVYNANGDVVDDTQTLTVHAAKGGVAPGQLSFTGSNVLPLAGGGALLLLLGVGTVVVARRRTSTQAPA